MRIASNVFSYRGRICFSRALSIKSPSRDRFAPIQGSRYAQSLIPRRNTEFLSQSILHDVFATKANIFFFCFRHNLAIFVPSHCIICNSTHLNGQTVKHKKLAYLQSQDNKGDHSTINILEITISSVRLQPSGTLANFPISRPYVE